jgi:hypothetical protein
MNSSYIGYVQIVQIVPAVQAVQEWDIQKRKDRVGSDIWR